MMAARKKPPIDWNKTATAFFVAVGFTCQLALLVMAKMDAHRAAVQAEAVRVTLEHVDSKTTVKLEDIKTTGEAVHDLVNSSMTAQLKISAVALRRLAMFTKDSDDAAAAELAEKLLHEHEVKVKQRG